ncbi:MAG: LUD domain-containing protein, partial [Bacteroidota bacterium]|nr:LUD domain-containing protein [Bacteroidota bacterium]
FQRPLGLAMAQADAAEAISAQLLPLRNVLLAGDALTRRCRIAEYHRDRPAAPTFHEADAAPGGEGAAGWKLRGASMDAGIGSGIAGIADAGAVIVHASEYESRSVSLLSALHIVLLPVAHILPSLMHAAPLLRAQDGTKGHSAVTIIGGPSKTADIEKVLVTGVHGPAAFVIVLIDSI